MFRNILVAVDGSPESDQALNHAIDLARSEKSKLRIVAGVQPLPAISYLGAAGDGFAKAAEGNRSDAREALRQATERVPADVPVSAVLTEEPIREELVRQIAEGAHDLVVMGSRGRGGVRSMLLGSVSTYVLHHSLVPVLIARGPRDTEAQGAVGSAGEDRARTSEPADVRESAGARA